MPSRDVFIYTGLLEVTDKEEDLLAAVIAHEISHCTERHIVEGLGFMALRCGTVSRTAWMTRRKSIKPGFSLCAAEYSSTYSEGPASS